MKFNFIYVASVAIVCLIVGVLTVTGVQSAKNMTSTQNLQVESTANTESSEVESESESSNAESEDIRIEESSSCEDRTLSEEEQEIFMDGKVLERADKPVIYIYSDVDDKYIEVAIDTNEIISCEYPKRDENGIWKIIAYKDGHIEDLNGQVYNYLYWEGLSDTEWDFSKGFCIKGSESREFLDKALNEIGLTRKEANEFIVYWLPKLEANEYNLISFQTDRYNDTYDLRVHPYCDNMLRVFMTYKGLNKPQDIKEQDLIALKGDFKREGFHVVEWGGSEVK